VALTPVAVETPPSKNFRRMKAPAIVNDGKVSEETLEKLKEKIPV
jgi:hypothetical protein